MDLFTLILGRNISGGSGDVLLVNAIFESRGRCILDKTYDEITQKLLAKKMVIINHPLYGTFTPYTLLPDNSVRFQTYWVEDEEVSIVGIIVHPDNTANWDFNPLSSGRFEYSSIVYNEDNTVTLTEKDGTVHTMSCTYDNGKLIGVTYDGKAVELTYNGDVLVKVGKTAVDVANAPANIGGLDHTVTFTVDGKPYEIVNVKAGNSVNPPATTPTKDDYRFSGWELNSEKVKFPYVPTENTDLIASFSQGIPSDYVLYVPLRQESATAETGQSLSVVGSGLTYGVVDGVECAMFNSTSEIGVSVNSNLFVKGKPFTISMWAKADSVASTSYGPAFFGFNNNFKYYQCQNVSDVHNVPAFYIGDVWGGVGNTYRMTSWVHICLVYDGSQISMYSNGVSGDKYAVSSNFSTTNTLYLGGNGSGDRFANGKMSAFRVYDRALTEEEITILSQEFKPTDR